MNDTVEQNAQTRRIAVGIVVGLLAGGAAWWFMDRNSHLPLDTVGAPSLPDVLPAPPPPADIIAHPLAPEIPAANSASAALPADPDAAAAAALDEVFGAATLAEWLIPERLSRRLVATLDNLSRDAKTEALRPLRAPPGPVVVERETLDATVGSEKITLSAANAARYDAPVALLARTDMGLAAQVYRRLYPQLQRAYEDLGYPGRYFNDRVVETIDHLLATPEPAGPLLLEQPKVLYRFADAGLESRSAGQKLLLRMGVEHARTVKNKLREFRAEITSKE